MATANVNQEFAEFGRKMKAIGFIILFDFIISIIGSFLSFMSYISIVFGLAQLFFLFSALINIKTIGYALNNQNLLTYREKMIIGVVMGLFGSILLGIGIGSILFTLIAIAPLFIGIVFAFIGGFIEMKAWQELLMFFEQNRSMFNERVSYDAIKGANYLKNAALCTLLSFLIITILIAFLLRVAGYLKLARLEESAYGQAHPPGVQHQYKPPAVQPTASPIGPSGVKYCQSCGEKLVGDEKFCGNCGSPI